VNWREIQIAIYAFLLGCLVMFIIAAAINY
jgi:hypothetical protein